LTDEFLVFAIELSQFGLVCCTHNNDTPKTTVPRIKITAITPTRCSCERASVIAFAMIRPIAKKYRQAAIIGC
jgi:hypothetical protein